MSILSVCVCVALVIQHARRVRHIMGYWHPWPVWPYHIFLHYFINGAIFGRKLLNPKCVFWFSLLLLSEILLILRRIQRSIVLYVHSLHVKYPLFLLNIHETWIFWTDFRKKKSVSNLMKIRPAGADFCTDRHDEANSLFSIMRTRLKNLYCWRLLSKYECPLYRVPERSNSNGSSVILEACMRREFEVRLYPRLKVTLFHKRLSTCFTFLVDTDLLCDKILVQYVFFLSELVDFFED